MFFVLSSNGSESKFSRFWIVFNSFIAKKLLHRRHWRVFEGVCAFVMVGMACTKQVSWAPVHVQECTLRHMSVNINVNVCEYTLRSVYKCAGVCALCWLAFEDECRGFQLVYAEQLLLAWRAIFDRRRDRGVVCIFSICDGGLECMCVCVCVFGVLCTHTHTAYGVLWCEPRDRDETPGELEESRWIESQQICIRICVQSTHVYINDERRDEILTNCFFQVFFEHSKKKSKRCECNTENSNPNWFKVHRPSMKSTWLLYGVIKAINITTCIFDRILKYFITCLFTWLAKNLRTQWFAFTWG